MTLDEEKQLEALRHQLQIRRLIFDKIALGLLIGVLAYAATFTLESWKSELAISQFKVEHRAEAIETLIVAHSPLIQHMVAWSNKGPRGVDSEKYLASIQEFVKVSGKGLFLFDRSFSERVNQYVWLHQAIAIEKLVPKEHVHAFVDDVLQGFSAMMRNGLDGKSISPGCFPPKAWSFEALSKGGFKAYFEANWDAWLPWKQQLAVETRCA